MKRFVYTNSQQSKLLQIYYHTRKLLILISFPWFFVSLHGFRKMKKLKKTYSFEVSPQTVDFNHQITLASFTDLLLTAAGYNAEENGFGMRKLNDQGLSWVLLRLAIEINKRPSQYEKIYIETWIEAVNRVTTSRNFCIRDDKQKIIGYASSNWAMINNESRKAQDLHQLNGIQFFETNHGVPIDKPKKIAAINGELINKFRTKYSHIDVNRHVNTMRYIEWISNYFSLEHYERKKLKRLDVNFMSEILFNEKVKIFKKEENDKYLFEILHEDKVSCRANIIFQNS